MKILMLTHEFPPFQGGIATYASGLAGAASELGHEVTVLAPNHGEDSTTADNRDYPFEVIRYRSDSYSYKKLIPLLWRSWHYLDTERYDVIHAVDAAYVLSLAFLNKVRDVPFAATVYGTDILAMPGSLQARLLAVRDMYARPHQVFSISEFTQNLLLERCPQLPREKVRITPLGVDEFWFTAPENVESTLLQFHIPENHTVLLTVSRLDERKGHSLVLAALSELPAELADRVTYLIVGRLTGSSYEADLRRRASECKARVVFTGSVSREQLQALYSRADIFCMPGEPHPNKVEGFGLAYLEAAAQRVPSIASRIGGVPEVVLDSKTGILIDPGDRAGLVNALKTLVVDEDYRKKLGQNAERHARTFTWRRCAELTYGC